MSVEKGFVDTIRNWNGEIIIYGAGIWGERVYELLSSMHINVDFIAVSCKGEKEVFAGGQAIKEIVELQNLKDSSLVIVAMNALIRDEAFQMAKDLGFQNILLLAEEEYWLNVLEEAVIPKGEKFCPVCRNTVKLFFPFGNPIRYNAKCPKCDSLERHRGFWLFLENGEYLKGDKKLLHFAPERGLIDRIRNMKNVDYYPVDINKDMYGIRDCVDITNIPYEDKMFDIIICNHVLEHIENEQKALSEMARVLSDTGIAFINVPVYDIETTLENPEYDTPDLRAKYYGQADHVRKYGKDYIKHLEREFKVSKVECNKEMNEEDLIRYGVWRDEIIYICEKK